MENIGKGECSLFDILDVVGVIINILVELNEVQTILNIGAVSKRHYEYLHSKKLWQNFCDRVFYDKSTTRISSNMIRSIFKHTQHETEFPLLVSDLYSKDTTKLSRAVEHLRRLLNYNEDIFAFQTAGLVFPLVKLLDADDQPKLQYEVSWILTKIPESKVHRLGHAGAILPMLKLLKSDNLEQQEQSARVLALAAEHDQTRDKLLDEGVLNIICNIIKAYKRVETVRACMSLLKNLCRRNLRPNFIQPAFPLSLDVIMRDTRDMQVCNEACLTLAHLGRSETIQFILARPNALQTIITLMPGVESTRAAFNAGFVAQFKNMLIAAEPAKHLSDLFLFLLIIMREAANVQILIEDGELFPLILEVAKNPASSDLIKRQTMHIIIHALDRQRNVSTYKYLLGIGALEPLCKRLKNWVNESYNELNTFLGVLHRMLDMEAQGELEGVKVQIESWCQALYELSLNNEKAQNLLSEYFSTFTPNNWTNLNDSESNV